MSPPPNITFSPEQGHPQKGQILAIMCSCLILVVAGVSSLNIAIPAIIEDLEPSSTQTLWIIDSYALVFAGLLLPAGAIGDRYGRKGALQVGLVLFAACAIWAAYAGSANELIIARGVMGVGAALVMPATLSILIAVFPPAERAKAIAVWSGFAGAGGAIGVLAGGALLEAFWWGSIFFVNLPLAAIAMVLISLVVPSSRSAYDHALDPFGSVLSIAGLGLLVYAIIEGGEKGWGEPTTVAFFAVAAVLLAAFVAYELRQRQPMLDPRLFKHLPFGIGSLTVAAAFSVMFGMFFIITQYFQFGQGHSALIAGVRNLPFPIAMVVVSPRSPMLAARIGKRLTLCTGLLLQAAGFVALALVEIDTPYIVVGVALAILGTGMALLMPAASEAIVSSLPPSKAGVGSAVNDTTREVGGSLGIAVLGTLLAAGYRADIGDATAALPPELADRANDGIGGAFRVAQENGMPELIQPAREAFTNGMARAFFAAAAISLATSVIVYWKYPRRGREPAQMTDAELASH